MSAGTAQRAPPSAAKQKQRLFAFVTVNHDKNSEAVRRVSRAQAQRRQGCGKFRTSISAGSSVFAAMSAARQGTFGELGDLMPGLRVCFGVKAASWRAASFSALFLSLSNSASALAGEARETGGKHKRERT